MAQWLVLGFPNSGCTQPRYLRYDRVTSTTIVRLLEAPTEEWAEPEVWNSRDGLIDTTLRVALSDHVIGDQQVRLRSYNGQVTRPTLRFKPGESVRILLANELAPNPDPMPSNHNIPHHFNTTNLHTHGLHISPSNSSDNVLLKIEPGERFQYRFAWRRERG